MGLRLGTYATAVCRRKRKEKVERSSYPYPRVSTCGCWAPSPCPSVLTLGFSCHSTWQRGVFASSETSGLGGCWASPSIVGLYHSSLGSLGFTVCRWDLPSVVGLHRPSLGSTVRHLDLPSVVGIYRPPLGYTLRPWALSSVLGLCPPSLGSTLHRWVLPFVFGLCPSPWRLRPPRVGPPNPPRRVLYALCSSFGSTAHLVALRLVARVHVVSDGLMLRCSTLRHVVSRYTCPRRVVRVLVEGT